MFRITLGRTALVAGALVALVPLSTAQPPTGSTGSSGSQSRISGTVPSQSQRINELILKGYEAGGIKKPAERCSDNEFIRRVFVDLIGRIATPEEVIDFEADKSPTKRVKLVQRLLYDTEYKPKNSAGAFYPDPSGDKGKKLKFDYTEEYAEHWANIWTVWLMTRSGHQDYRNQMRLWLEIQFSKQMISHKDMVSKLLTATGTTGEDRASRGGNPDANAVNFVMAHLGEPVPAAKRNEGAFEAVPITSRVTRVFLGIQTQCTQCHDHPHNKQWLQADFWGVNAFFRQTVRSATPTPAAIPGQNNAAMQAAAITLRDDASLNNGMLIGYDRRDGKKIDIFPTMLKDLAQAENGLTSAKILENDPAGKTRRQQLAEWVVTHDSFSKAYANRMWGHFFGRGLNKDSPVDDFGSHNELIHPELLAYLADEFKNANYDPKKMLEWIACSDVYSLSHVSVKDYAAPKYDPYFARMPLKAMSPEVLFDSLMTATRGEFKNKEDRKALRDAWMRKLVRNFGDDEGNELTFNGTVVQALLMMNGTELNGEIGVGTSVRGKPNNPSANVDNVVADVVKRHSSGGNVNADGVFDELFLLTLNRKPTGNERALLKDVQGGRAKVDLGAPEPPKPGKPPKPPGGVIVPPSSPNDVSFYQDVFWALLNTNEFMLNH